MRAPTRPPPNSGWARLLGRGRRQRGVAEAALLYPFLLLLTFTGLQLGFYFHAAQVAQAAATVAFNGAHGLDASASDGDAAATAFLDSRRGELLAASVDVQLTPTELTVIVTGQAPGIIPGWVWLDVNGTYTGPVERWTG